MNEVQNPLNTSYPQKLRLDLHQCTQVPII